VLLVAFAACSDSPVSPDLFTVDDAIVAQFAEEASEASDVRLPSLGALVRASRAAIEARGGNAEAVRFFRQARRLLGAAKEAHTAGSFSRAIEAATRAATLAATVLQGRG